MPVIGVSPDDGVSHQRFRNKYGLRSTFLLDEQGRVERAWHNVRADGHAASVLSQLRS